ncbi:MAG: alkaline phosphatase, partial [Armatimonadota bacterium]|nr:alkaline phosphatase [Armatimonadota bacterium]
MKIRRLILSLLVILTLLSCLPVSAAPKNVILMIGDGMGVAQVTLARLSLSESSRPLNMDSMKYAALVKTCSADSIITDSAAAGTALATGHKTNNGMICILPDGKPVQTILEAAEKIGKATGLVTTTTITHATPASFGSHVESRGSEADIAPQYLINSIEVLLGGGRMFFIPKSQEQSKREDDRDLLAEAKTVGYTVVDSRDGLLSADGNRLLGLFEMGSLTTESPEPSLAEMTAKAIDILSKDKDGFFLMVEGGQIDWKCHANDVPGTVKQTLDFDAAIGKVLDFARKRGDTLVIVT